MFPLISICIPSFSQADLLERCLQSILAQDYKNIEVVISDDTPDESVKIIAEKYSAQMSLVYQQNNPALGSPANWNNALDIASGDLLLLLHHDDWLANPQSISSWVQAFELTPAASVVFARTSATNKFRKKAGDNVNGNFLKSFYDSPVKLLLHNVLGPPSNVMMKKKVQLRYNISYKWLVDLEFYLRLFLDGHKFAYLDEQLVHVGLHDGQMTNFIHRNAEILVRENVLFAAEYLPLLKDNLIFYDHFWRLLRNHHVRSKNDLLQMGLREDISPYILKMVKAQAKVPVALLKIGAISKAAMLLSYLMR